MLDGPTVRSKDAFSIPVLRYSDRRIVSPLEHVDGKLGCEIGNSKPGSS